VQRGQSDTGIGTVTETETETEMETKKYNLITKGVREVGDVKKGDKVHILGGFNQVPFRITKVLLGKDVYPVNPESVNVGAKARLVVTVDKEYPANTEVSLIGDEKQMFFIGEHPKDRELADFTNKRCWKEHLTQKVMRAQIVNPDYQENWALQVFPALDHNSKEHDELLVWSCPDDVPVKIKGIFINTENPEDKKYLRVWDVRVGKDSQFVSADELSIQALEYMETDTCNVGQLLSIKLRNIFSEPCKECGKAKTRPIPITGYVLAEIPDFKK